MRSYLIAGAAGLALSAPLSAQAAVSEQEVAELKQQVQMLLQRVQQLEAQNADLTGAGATPSVDATRVEQLEARVAEVEATNDSQTDQIAQGVAKDKSMDWASKLKWKGDFRYRHEMIDEETRDTRTRQRIRARLGVEAKVADNLKAVIQIATGDLTDPRSTNTTLGGGNLRKTIGLDLGYVDWTVADGMVVSLGKMKYPFERFGGSLFYDGDVNPEGGAIRYRHGSGLFASGWGFWINEFSSQADPMVYGAQLGWESGFGLTLAGTYQNFSALQNSTAGLVDFGGNSTYGAAGTDCNGVGSIPCYLYDYELVELSAEYAFELGSLPISLWADYLHNTAVDDLNEGYNLGFTLGKASDPGSWEFAALYQDLEKDAAWGGWIDSDFAGGTTQGKGFLFKGAYVPVKNTSLNLTWFENTRNYDTSSERDYQRLQLDFSMKF